MIKIWNSTFSANLFEKNGKDFKTWPEEDINLLIIHLMEEAFTWKNAWSKEMNRQEEELITKQ